MDVIIFLTRHWKLSLALLILLLLISPLSEARAGSNVIRSYTQDSSRKEQLKRTALDLNNIATENWESSENEKAIKFFLKSLPIYNQLNDEHSISLIQFNIGLIFFEMEDYRSSLDYFQSSYDWAIKKSSTSLAVDNLLHLGLANGNIKKTRKAIKYILEAYHLSSGIDDKIREAESCRLLSKYYNILGDERKSYEYMMLYTLSQKNRENEEIAGSRALQINRMKAKMQDDESKLFKADSLLSFQGNQLVRIEDSLRLANQINEKRKLKIELLSAEEDLKDVIIESQKDAIASARNVRNLLIGIFVLGCITGILFWKNHKEKKLAADLIKVKNDAITSSINYAQRIQKAMMPEEEDWYKVMKDSFIFLKPRDIVSGDFYWFTEIEKKNGKNDIVVASVDCTGHGIPGAFMSMIGIKSLNSIVKRGIHKADLILNELHLEVLSALRQNESGNNDGMDMSLCVIRSEDNVLEFAGAKNPLIYIQNKELFQVKGNLHPIGGMNAKRGDFKYSRYELNLNLDTVIYLFSDGFKDQFGADNSSKFMSKKFKKLLLDIHSLPMAVQKTRLETTLKDWMGDNRQTDDVLVMGFKLNGTMKKNDGPNLKLISDHSVKENLTTNLIKH